MDMNHWDTYMMEIYKSYRHPWKLKRWSYWFANKNIPNFQHLLLKYSKDLYLFCPLCNGLLYSNDMLDWLDFYCHVCGILVLDDTGRNEFFDCDRY